MTGKIDSGQNFSPHPRDQIFMSDFSPLQGPISRVRILCLKETKFSCQISTLCRDQFLGSDSCAFRRPNFRVRILQVTNFSGQNFSPNWRDQFFVSDLGHFPGPFSRVRFFFEKSTFFNFENFKRKNFQYSKTKHTFFKAVCRATRKWGHMPPYPPGGTPNIPPKLSPTR